MNNRTIIYLLFSSLLLLVSCLKDDGNYKYTPLTGRFDFGNTDMPTVYCSERDTVRQSIQFNYDGSDSLERLADLRYEWKLNGIIFSEEKELQIPTENLMAKVGLKEFPGAPLTGTYSVIEKSTGISYMCTVLFAFFPEFPKGQWLILSEQGNGSRLSYQHSQQKWVEGVIKTIYKNYPDIFKQSNGGMEIPGKPVNLIDHEAVYISPSVGATLLLTDQVAWELTNESFKKVSDLKEQFLDGAPANFKIKDAYYDRQMTFIVAEDGRLFRRQFSENYLGGKFMTEPYTVDDKGYDIAFFTNGQRYYLGNMSLLYDQKNNRLLAVNQVYNPMWTIYPVTPAEGEHPVKVWDLGEAKVLQASRLNADLYPYTQELNAMIFNEGGQTYMANFVLETNYPAYYAKLIVSSYATKVPFPGGNLDTDSKILMSGQYGTAGMYIFYTRGNELRYVNRANNSDNPCLTFDAPITALRYASGLKELGVGLSNGDFMRVNITSVSSPKILEDSKVNVGGKIVALSHTGGGYHFD